MCFAAAVNFTISIVLAISGIVLILRTSDKRFLALAAIPCFFAIQQTAEGFLWIALPNPSLSKNIYLFFTYSFWPVWIPFSIWLIERNKQREMALIFLLGMGLATALILASKINKFDALPNQMRIQYRCFEDEKTFLWPLSISYVIAILGSYLTSSIRTLNILGIITFAVWGVFVYMGVAVLDSLWCFFMALSSPLLFWCIPKRMRN